MNTDQETARLNAIACLTGALAALIEANRMAKDGPHVASMIMAVDALVYRQSGRMP